MKKILLTIIFMCSYCIAKSQMTYTPLFRDDVRSQQQYQQQSQPQYRNETQTQRQNIRTTAYYIDNNGDYIKIPIIVTITTYIHPTGNSSQVAKVTSYYSSFGIGGRWENLAYDGAEVKKNNPIVGGLEQSFMYNAYLPMAGIVYFDL